MLSTILATPLIAAVLLFLVPRKQEALLKVLALLVQGFLLLSSIRLLFVINRFAPGFHLIEQKAWIPSFGIKYLLGADTLSVSFVILTHLLMFLALLMSWKQTHKIKEYLQLLLLLSSALGGVFLAQDAFLFFVCFEFTLLPMFFLIGGWGAAKREYAATKFFVYTFVGSLFILAAFLLMWSEARTWSVEALSKFDWSLSEKAKWVPWLLLIGFAIKIPLVPFHTWLPWAHVQAPAPVSMLLAGVLLKMGVYGLLRYLLFLFPSFVSDNAVFLMGFGLLNIFWGGFCAFAQNDLKRLIAYSSVAHMGFCLLGIGSMNALGVNGVALHMFNHGICSAMLFALAGVLYERVGHHEMFRLDGSLGFGALRTRAPKISFFLQLAAFASLGLPTLNSFIGEAMILGGIVNLHFYITLATLLGMLLGAAYFVWMLKQMVWSSEKANQQRIEDLYPREIFVFTILGLIIVGIGLYPMPVIEWFESSVGVLLGGR